MAISNFDIQSHVNGIKHWVAEREKIKIEENSLIPVHFIKNIQKHLTASSTHTLIYICLFTLLLVIGFTCIFFKLKNALYKEN